MKKVIKIAIFDEDSYFRAGLQEILAKHFRSYGKRVLLLDVKQFQEVDLVFCYFPPGLKSCFCRFFKAKITGRETLYFSLRRPEERYKRNVRSHCSLEAGVIYHDMSLDSVLNQVKSTLGKSIHTINYNLCDARENELTSGFERLTKRELEVLYLMIKANRGCQIAKKLNLSEKTVSCYKMRVMRKLGFNRNFDFYKWIAYFSGCFH